MTVRQRPSLLLPPAGVGALYWSPVTHTLSRPPAVGTGLRKVLTKPEPKSPISGQQMSGIAALAAAAAQTQRAPAAQQTTADSPGLKVSQDFRQAVSDGRQGRKAGLWGGEREAPGGLALSCSTVDINC